MALTDSLMEFFKELLSQNHQTKAFLDSLPIETMNHNFMKCCQNIPPKECIESGCPGTPCHCTKLPLKLLPVLPQHFTCIRVRKKTK